MSGRINRGIILIIYIDNLIFYTDIDKSVSLKDTIITVKKN